MNRIIKQAFTLIELLVVIAIIGILSGLIVVVMSGMTEKANIAKAQVFSNSLKNSLMLNLVSEWRFDGNTTDGSVAVPNDVLDTWKNTNNGTVPYPPTVETSDCVSDSCLEFSGAAASGAYNYVDFGTNSSLSMGTGDTTVSLWVKFDNAVAPSNETLVYCGSGNAATGYPGYWILRNNESSWLWVAFSDGTANPISTYLSLPGSLVNNIWYNVVVVFDRDGAAQAYINGIKQTRTLTISAQQGSITNNTSYKMGATSLSGNRLDGKMDEVRLYNAAMPTSQIKEQYYAGLNQLLTKGGLTQEEYSQRMSELAKK